MFKEQWEIIYLQLITELFDWWCSNNVYLFINIKYRIYKNTFKSEYVAWWIGHWPWTQDQKVWSPISNAYHVQLCQANVSFYTACVFTAVMGTWWTKCVTERLIACMFFLWSVQCVFFPEILNIVQECTPLPGQIHSYAVVCGSSQSDQSYMFFCSVTSA